MNNAGCADSHATTAHRGSGICAGDIGVEVAVARKEIRRRRGDVLGNAQALHPHFR